MFHLIKKDKEKDKEKEKDGGRKKEKKDKKERMSAAELRSLEEMSMRRGFFNLNRASKREARSRLLISSPIPIKVASGSELSLTALEGDAHLPEELSASSSTDELKGDGGVGGGEGQDRGGRLGQMMKAFSFSQRSKEESHLESSTPSGPDLLAPSPQAEDQGLEPQRKGLGTVRIPEVVDKTFPADLSLPALVAPAMPEPRELELQRRNTGDFGFSLRRTTMLDQGVDGAPYRRVVHFAEPGAGTKDLALGLVPGDRLVEINGRNVESSSRDEIVEMIRHSGDSVRLRVQPILELSELSRCWLRAREEQRREVSAVSSPKYPLYTPNTIPNTPPSYTRNTCPTAYSFEMQQQR